MFSNLISRTPSRALLALTTATALLSACGGSDTPDTPSAHYAPKVVLNKSPNSTISPTTTTTTTNTTATTTSSTRGFPNAGPWASFYGVASQVDLTKMASAFRIMDIDADPGVGNFTAAQIQTLRNGGSNKVLSYLNIGSCEQFRDYWSSVPSGFVSCSANRAAQLGAYNGYPDEVWMNPANTDYQNLILNFVAPRLVARGVDGFYLDNMEIVEHGTATTNGRCDATCSQAGLDLIAKLRDKYPNHLIVMQNATSDRTRLGTANGASGAVSFPSLLDGVAHEEVYMPTYDSSAEAEMVNWERLNLTPGGNKFWVATLDYVGACNNTTAAQSDYNSSRGRGFSPYASDASGGQQVVCYWSGF